MPLPAATRPRLARRAGPALAATAALLLAAGPAHATSTPTQIATATANGVAYLKTLQASDGSFVTGGGLSDEWAFSALAAAGTAAADVVPPGGTASENARSVYQSELTASTWPEASPVVTDYERGILNAYAAGIDPARVAASRNLIANLFSYWQPSSPGSWGPPANFNGTVFAVLALAGAKTQAGTPRVPQALLNASIGVIRANQHTDGGWDYPQAAGNPSELAATSDIDMTGATMAAMCSAGVAATDSAIVAAENFLKGKLAATTGAFNSTFGANTDSNGWAVQGLNACGIPAQTGGFLSSKGKTPIDFLLAQQVTGGGFKYQPSNTGATAYSSIDAVRAIAGGGFTAAPPVPTTPGAPRWAAASGFTPGAASTLAVIVDTGSGSLSPCSVSITPTGTTTTLGAVLDAAETAATPSGCVTGITPTSGTGTITTLDGVTDSGGATWKVSVDGGSLTSAARGATIDLGDTVYLHYGS
jgi:hypothetical protein